MAATEQACGRTALEALTAAALLLPGLGAAPAPALAQSEDAVALQLGSYREAARAVPGAPNTLQPLRADSQVLRASFGLPRGDALSLAVTQDSWSGATPVTTAPATALGNRPLRSGPAGQLVTVGASPMINGRVQLDALDRVVTVDPASGAVQPAQALVHTLSSASPETRQQVDARWNHRLAEGALIVGAGTSREPDFRSTFVSLGRRFDLDQQRTTLSLGLSGTRSDIAATLDHDAAPYITKTAYRSQIENLQGRQVLHGRRQEWSASAGLTRVLGPGALLEAQAGFTHSAGDLSNPYKLTSVIFAPPGAADAAGVTSGDLQALLEQRPTVRKQATAGVKAILHHAASDGALHLGYGHARDSWGLAAHRLEAEWFQPLGDGWMVAPRLRYHTQRAARFYVPLLVSRQAYRSVRIGADGQPVITNFDPALLPAHFSSDVRLAGFGSLGAGLGVSRSLGRGARLELGIDTLRQAGALKAGGGGEGAYANQRAWSASAVLRLDFGTPTEGRPATDDDPASHPAAHAAAHHASHEFAAPSGVMLAHAAGTGAVMVGLRQTLRHDAGLLREGTRILDDAEVIARACGEAPCAAAPTRMAMRMQMLELMVGLNEHVSLMLMPQAMRMVMDSRLLAGAVATDPALHVGRHESSGLGDTQLHAVLKLWQAPGSRALLGLGVSAPTGDSGLRHRRSHQQEPRALDYGMQTGSGTWDWLPSATWQGRAGAWSWGAQVSAVLRGEARNHQGYALGDQWQASGWLSRRLGAELSASLRGVLSKEGALKGQREQAGPASSPAEVAANQGGRFAELGVGLNLGALPGVAGGSSLGVEWLLPMRAEVRGIQLPRRSTLALHWSHHF